MILPRCQSTSEGCRSLMSTWVIPQFNKSKMWSRIIPCVFARIFVTSSTGIVGTSLCPPTKRYRLEWRLTGGWIRPFSPSQSRKLREWRNCFFWYSTEMFALSRWRYHCSHRSGVTESIKDSEPTQFWNAVKHTLFWSYSGTLIWLPIALDLWNSI